MTEQSLQQLIAKCKKNQRLAQAEIYQHFSSKMFGVCRIYSKTYEDAQDIFQEAFVHAFQKINQYQNKGSFEGWLRRIMVNFCIEKYRRDSKIQLVRNTDFTPDYETIDLDQEEVTSLNQSELFGLIKQLPNRYQAVFNLYVLDGFSHKEIAEELGISVGTSKSNLARARMWLQDQLKKKKRMNLEKISNEAFA